MTFIWAFIIAGLFCALGQIILDNTKLTPGHVTSLFTVLGSILAFFGIYDKLIDLAGGGATSIISNFGYMLYTAALEGYENMGKEALKIDANTFQFFTRNPRGSKAKNIDENDINKLTEMIIILEEAIDAETNTFIVPDSVTFLQNEILDQYTNITTVQIPASVQTISPLFIGAIKLGTSTLKETFGLASVCFNSLV